MCLAVPGRITELYEAAGLAMGRIDFGGVVREACMAYVPDARPGDYVLIHAGFAISQVDEAEARQTLADLERMGELAESEQTPE